jgi:cystathionine gamma-synthase
MKDLSNRRFETIAVHAGHGVDPATGAVTPPIHLSTTFERDADGSYPHGYVYARNHNPNRDGLEAALAALEGGAACAAFSSGLAAVTAIFQGLSPATTSSRRSDIYHGTANVLKHLFAKWQVQASFVDMTSLDAIARAMRPATRIVWIETPSNPLLQCVDIAAAAQIAHARGARAVCDNTFASPALQRPLELGCDLVMHATTKYLGGRSDVLGGAVVARADDAAFARSARAALRRRGAVAVRLLARHAQPADAAGAHADALRERAPRRRRSCTTIRGLGGALSRPLGSPFHALARRQMRDFGGMLSFEVRAARTRRWRSPRGPSLHAARRASAASRA